VTAAIRVNDLRKTFANTVVALDGVSFDVEPGEFVSLLGPSGCGKTTMLRSIAGLEEPDSGNIEITGKTVFASAGSRRQSLPPEKRGLSMVFQQYALWPHMTVFGNVAFGLSMRGTSKTETEAKVKRALDRVQLWHVRDRRISALSGGQQQRIALARAIAFDPAVILFDEPLSNLDANLREEMRLQLLELQYELGFTALYVTHDQAEAMSLSDRILVMNQGCVEQNASPQEVWDSPGSAFVARFVGSSNIFHGVVAESTAGRSVVRLGDSALTCVVAADLQPARDVELFMRFHDVRVSRDEPRDCTNTWQGTVRLLSYEGHQTVVKLDVSGVEMVALVPSSLHLVSGEPVFVSVPEDCVRAFAAVRSGQGALAAPEPAQSRG
jgi:iron(III) transport system ATP-binding protein